MQKLLTAFLLLVVYCSSAYSMDADTNAYYNAYNICSPSAQKQTMDSCGYAAAVEGYYTACMTQKGFGEDDDKMDKARYTEYLSAYRTCSVVANNAAQKACNYGSVYQGLYNKCMAGYGYDSNGERLGSAKRTETKTSPEPAENKNIPQQQGVGKLFDSLF